jgi:type IV pilus assembly protein PilW
MTNTYPQHRSIRRNCRGFSLVELMIALVITLILLGGISQIFLSSKKSFTVQDTLGRMQENGRFAVDMITADLRRAGYWGGNADISQITGTLGTADDDGTCNSADTSWGRMIETRIYGLNDTNAGYACLTGYTQGDALVLRYASPWVLGGMTLPAEPTDPENTNRIFLRSSLFAGRIFQGKDFDSQQNDMDLDTSTPPNPAERVSELIAHAYHIGTTAASQCEGVNTPTLRRVALGNNGQPVSAEIARGVEQLQVRYGLRKPDPLDPFNPNKYTIEFRDADAVGTEWNDVIAARLWLLTRAECPETGFTNTNTYPMGDIVYDPDPDDGFRRQLYQSTVFLRNR